MRKLGYLLSAMVFRNISVIIAVGIIKGFFGIYGWFYNDRILLLVNPIYHTFLPVLLGYTGGKLLGGQRGAVVAAFVTYGLTLASSVPMIFGAMVVGPLTGLLVNKIDHFVGRRIPVGYELLILNVIAAFIAVILTSFCFLYVGQIISEGIKWLHVMLETVIYSGWLPLAALVIEPAKVLFFNNFLNYGILVPLGAMQAKDLGKSILFLLEANPGPGLGVLLAYWLKTKKESRGSVKLSVVIHFFGGIQEVSFPYVLFKPLLIIAVVFGGMAGILTFQWFHVGLVSPAAPGSIFLLMGLSPREELGFVLAGVAASVSVSFAIAYFILDEKTAVLIGSHNERQLDALRKLQLIDPGKEKKADIPADATLQSFRAGRNKKNKVPDPIRKVTFACDAGLGSSAMGAAMLRKKLAAENLDVRVDHSSVDDIPAETDLIVCQERLLKAVEHQAPSKAHFPIQSFTNQQNYDEMIMLIKKGGRESS
ncbi:MAG TPA: PTS transporter subunit EIIC [Bacillales bacterium]|nr:PTS transporter subunit EIIC [Bacillales bacterium]